MTFIKAANSSTPVSSSRTEIEKMLRRYGATGFGVQQEFDNDGYAEKVNVQFIVPDAPGSKARVPVALPIEIRTVARKLYPKAKSYTQAQWQRAERVAWRNLVLWIDAALSASAIGLQTITEAFFAHTVIQLEDGRTARLGEYIAATQSDLAPGVRALLAAPPEAK